MRTRLKTATAVAAVTVALAVPVAAAQAHGQRHEDGKAMPGYSLKGSWVVTIDPDVAPPAAPPPFESTIAYGAGHTVVEATARAPMSAGVGSWKQIGKSRYETTFQKYRFDSTGTYIGKTVIDEKVHLTGPTTYSSHSTTQIIDSTGTVSSQFTAHSTAKRLTP